MLYVLATPIGNRDDLTIRALHALQNVDLIICEDRKETLKLLQYFHIEKPLINVAGYGDQHTREDILELINQGKKVALVTNGTPGIADPGNLLIQQAIIANVEITMLPGPSAFIMALILSGLPLHGFTFRGYPPRSAHALSQFLEVDKNSPHTIIYYVLAERLTELLREVLSIFGERKAAIANDLTSDHETIQRGTLSELWQYYVKHTPRGNFTLVIAGNWRLYAKHAE